MFPEWTEAVAVGGRVLANRAPTTSARSRSEWSSPLGDCWHSTYRSRVSSAPVLGGSCGLGMVCITPCIVCFSRSATAIGASGDVVLPTRASDSAPDCARGRAVTPVVVNGARPCAIVSRLRPDHKHIIRCRVGHDRTRQRPRATSKWRTCGGKTLGKPKRDQALDAVLFDEDHPTTPTRSLSATAPPLHPQTWSSRRSLARFCCRRLATAALHCCVFEQSRCPANCPPRSSAADAAPFNGVAEHEN